MQKMISIQSSILQLCKFLLSSQACTHPSFCHPLHPSTLPLTIPSTLSGGQWEMWPALGRWSSATCHQGSIEDIWWPGKWPATTWHDDLIYGALRHIRHIHRYTYEETRHFTYSSLDKMSAVMMISWFGNAFCITGHLWDESTGHK